MTFNESIQDKYIAANLQAKNFEIRELLLENYKDTLDRIECLQKAKSKIRGNA